MSLKNVLSITEARGNIFNIANEAQKKGTYFTLTQNGRPKAVIMSADEFESWQETLEVMNDFPDLENDTERIKEEYKRGEYQTLDELLLEEGYILAKR